MIDPGDIELRLVRTQTDLEEFWHWLEGRYGSYVAFDTETTGLDWTEYAHLRLAQFGDTDIGWVLPARWFGREIFWAIEHLLETDTPLVIHNASFDLHTMREAEMPHIPWSSVVDTMTLLHLNDNSLPRSLKGYGVAKVVGPWAQAGGKLLTEEFVKMGLSKSEGFRHIPIENEVYWAYSALDPVITARVFEELKHLRGEFPEAYEREHDFASITYGMTQRGVMLDTAVARERHAEFTERAAKLKQQLIELGVEEPGKDSSALRRLEELGWVPSKLTPTGNPAFDKEIKERLAERDDDIGDLVSLLMDYGRTTKWLSTYLDKFVGGTGMVHVQPSMMPIGTDTGRSVVTDPPLQTQPAELRSLFKPRPGHVWCSIDFQSQEPRLLAHFTQSEELLQFFREGEGSMHDFVAAKLFGENFTPEQRAVAKMMGLARAYSAGADTLASRTGFPPEQVKRFLVEYDALMGLDVLEAKINRRRPKRAHTIGGRVLKAKHGASHKLLNYTAQGSGADVMKDACRRLVKAGFEEYMLLTVYDEVCFEFPEDRAEELMAEAMGIMTDDSLSVLLPVGGKLGTDWAEASK